ncbi:MAG TPA: glycosidase, partial [Caldithrix sp.]|nr:glycosidase [Caldithrix sp.]
FDNLLDEFTYDELVESIERFKKKKSKKKKKIGTSAPRYLQALEILEWLAVSTYSVEFKPDLPLSGRVIFPLSINDRKGLEDARFVRFTNSDSKVKYYATYTAYNGITILPQLIETEDFCSFKISTLNGSGSQNKGMALFPEKINGKYAMISRNDNENLFIMYSDDVRFWERPKLLKEPEVYWEFFQIGNSGPPLKTKKGWLLLTHGVGPVRTYCVGAILLDLKNPEKVLGVLEEPLIVPEENERDGYVPNVVYSCGAIIHKACLIVPYAMSDTRSGIAKFNLEQIFENMKLLENQ